MIFSKEILEQTLLTLSVETLKVLKYDLLSKDKFFLNDYAIFGIKETIDIIDVMLKEYYQEREEKNLKE